MADARGAGQQPLGVVYVRDPNGRLDTSNVYIGDNWVFRMPGRPHHEMFRIATADINGRSALVVTFSELNVRMKIWEEDEFRADICPPSPTMLQLGDYWIRGTNEEYIPGINPRTNELDADPNAPIQVARELVRRPGDDGVITALYMLKSDFAIALVEGVQVVTLPLRDDDTDSDTDGAPPPGSANDSLTSSVLRGRFGELEDVGFEFVGDEIDVDDVATRVPEGEGDMENCTICQEDEYNANHIPVRLNTCGHVFGRDCLHGLLNHPTAPLFICPNCRVRVFAPRQRRPIIDNSQFEENAQDEEHAQDDVPELSSDINPGEWDTGNRSCWPQ
ncbi:hypothetical protein BU16DRAFT_621843 [Lophium mytilinum]|uniref:RING-type domain-containing protein n=1 Tax=Lophium mytilinum TaxID=390894 RepID=A0A6A6QFR2_9PEZI|nr:hypothetical protein BU16DRAFT_621843 [Lophium mytilinum]